MKVHFVDSCGAQVNCVAVRLGAQTAAVEPGDWSVCRRCRALYRCVQTYSVDGRGGPLTSRLFWVEVERAQLETLLSHMHIADKLVLIEALDHFKAPSVARGQA